MQEGDKHVFRLHRLQEPAHERRVLIMKHAVLLIGIVGLLPVVQCEAELMTLHRKCSDRSRNITSEACKLKDDFRELRGLMSMRETEFAMCVGHDSVREVELTPSTKHFSECNVTVAEPTVIQGCWRSVAVVKRRCQRLKKCCPASDRCMKRLASSDTTALVRRKHVDINLKTLKCLNDMESIIRVFGNDETKSGRNIRPALTIPFSPLVSRAHAVIIARTEALMDVVGQDQFMRTDLKSVDPLFPQKKIVRTRAKHVTSILKSRYTELARIAEELSAILVQKRQKRRQKELMKRYGSGFSSGKGRKALSHSVKEKKVEGAKQTSLLSSLENATEKLEPFTTHTVAASPSTMTIRKLMKFRKNLKFATVTSSGEIQEVTKPATTTTTTTIPTTTTHDEDKPRKVSNTYGRSRENYWPEFSIDSQTRTTIAPTKLRSNFRRKPVIKEYSPSDATSGTGTSHIPLSEAELGAVRIPNLQGKKMTKAKSVEVSSSRVSQEQSMRAPNVPRAKVPKQKVAEVKFIETKPTASSTVSTTSTTITATEKTQEPTTVPGNRLNNSTTTRNPALTRSVEIDQTTDKANSTAVRALGVPHFKIPLMPEEGAPIPNLPQKSPSELQEYLRRNKGELQKTTTTPKTTTQPEAYVGNDGTWTLDPPKSEEEPEDKSFPGANNELITHEEGTFPVSPYHKELMGDKSSNEIRRSGKHKLSKRKFSKKKLRKMVEAMVTGEPLFAGSAEKSSKDGREDHPLPHIVEKEIVDSSSNGAMRIPFNLVDNSVQDRMGIFPITTKEPRRIKITMWPPGYRNHFTHHHGAHKTTSAPRRAAAAGTLTSGMPESFYKVFYPQLKPEKRRRLKGYRNKVLFARRHLRRQKGHVVHSNANTVTQPEESIPMAVTKLPIHRLRPKHEDNDLSANQITEEGVYHRSSHSRSESNASPSFAQIVYPRAVSSR
uniref:FHA domain-containing protein n=1 Tax=Steinernema glaseri TaxID=37863 RepID=A0A1I7ZXF9_9BILA